MNRSSRTASGIAAAAMAAALALAPGATAPAGAQAVPADPMAASIFTGTAPVTGACAIAAPAIEAIDGVVHKRGESWGCLTWTTDNSRFSGVSTNIFDTHEYPLSTITATGRTGSIVAGRERIENAAGAWEGTWAALSIGSELDELAGWFVGEGAYEGLSAYVVMSDPAGAAEVWGLITPGPPLVAPALVVAPALE